MNKHGRYKEGWLYYHSWYHTHSCTISTLQDVNTIWTSDIQSVQWCNFINSSAVNHNKISPAVSSASPFKTLFNNQCGPRSDYPSRSSLIWVHPVCMYALISPWSKIRLWWWYDVSICMQQTTSADNILGCIFCSRKRFNVDSSWGWKRVNPVQLAASWSVSTLVLKEGIEFWKSCVHMDRSKTVVCMCCIIIECFIHVQTITTYAVSNSEWHMPYYKQ